MLIDTYRSMIVRFASRVTRGFLSPLCLSLDILFMAKENLWDQGTFTHTSCNKLPSILTCWFIKAHLPVSSRGIKADWVNGTPDCLIIESLLLVISSHISLAFLRDFPLHIMNSLYSSHRWYFGIYITKGDFCIEHMKQRDFCSNGKNCRLQLNRQKIEDRRLSETRTHVVDYTDWRILSRT